MKRFLLFILFVGLMADGMFGWGLGIAPGLSLKNALLYLLVLIKGIEIALAGRKVEIQMPQIHLMFGVLFFTAMISWAANSLVGSYINYSALDGFISLKGSLLDHYLFFLMFFIGVRSERDVLWLQKWVLIIIALGNIVTVLDAYNLPNLNLLETRDDGRVEGPLGEANQYGLFVAMFLPMLLAKAWTERGVWRAFLVIGSAASFLVLLMTVSRGAMLALVAGSIFSVFYLRQYMNSQYVKRVLIFGCLAVVGAALIIGPQYIDLIADRMSAGTSGGGNAYDLTSGRTWIWSTAIGIMMNDPLSLLTGYGWHTFSSVMDFAPHNVYLGRFFELGVVGLLSFIGLMFTVIVSSKRTLPTHSVDSALVPAQIGFTFGFVILTMGIFSVDLTNPWYFVWSYVGLAMRGGVILMTEPLQSASTSNITANHATQRGKEATDPQMTGTP